MGFCYELDTGCCGCPVRSMTCTALCHYMIYGIACVSFVFTNICYPPFYYVDYMLGGSGAALFLISFFTAWVVDFKKFQFIRCLLAFLTTLVVLATVVSTFYYVIERWYDVMVTALTSYLRPPPHKDLPDTLWYTLAVILCINTPIFLFYLIYVWSFMCNQWKSHLFTSPYQNNRDVSALFPPITIPEDRYSSRSYKPYPLEKNFDTQRNN